MFKLFKRRKGEITTAHEGWNRVGEWINRQQRHYADWLQDKTKGMSAKVVALWLMLFCLAIAISSAYILYQTFF